jgi:hypothetical protein
MKFTNVSGCEAGWMSGYEPDGREMLIVIVKASYRMPGNGEQPEPAAEPVPLVQEDKFTGAPGFSAPQYETDYSHRKPHCDVIVVGSAYAPSGKSAKRVPVRIRVADMDKQFVVVGNRVWIKRLSGVSISDPRRFTSTPITYDVAFGGTDRTLEGSKGQVFTYTANPVGRGYWHDTRDIDGKPLPNTESADAPVVDPHGSYEPMSFSPVGRNWSARARHAGTYDTAWLENEAPFWPKDFDYRYFQAAPEDQWIRHPGGGEVVALQNLTPDGDRRFRLPSRRMPVTFLPYRGRDVTREAVVDTIVLEPDQERFTLTWRTSLALGKSLFDVKEAIAGEMPAGWHRARRGDKTYYPSLGALVAARRRKTA